MGRNSIQNREINYNALPSQKRFHECTARFKGYSGSIGSGKSQAMCHEAVRLSYLNPGRMGLIGAPTYPMLRDATLTSFLEILGQNEIPYEFNKAEFLLTFPETRARIVFRSLDDFERLRGTNLAWFGVDELTYTAEEAWLRLEGRLRDPRAKRLCGFGVWTPKGHDWVYRKFIKDGPEAYEVIVARPFENHHLLDKVPDFYERLRSSYDERFFRQEVLGEYINTKGGLVYREFDRDRHVSEVERDPQAALFWALDFNVNPMCSVVAQICGEDVLVLDEIVIDRATTREACEEFSMRFGQHRAGLRVYGDASGQSMKTSGSSDYEIIRQFFRSTAFKNVRYAVPGKNPFVRDRVELVNAKLRNAYGEVHLRISPRCKELIRDFEEVTYKADTTLVDKERDPRRTHLSDALGYLMWQEFKGRKPAGERGDRLL